MRKPINYSKCYSRRYHEEKVRKEKKDTLKKIGYFLAGAGTAIGIGYAVKKIYSERFLDCHTDIFQEDNQVVLAMRTPTAPFFLKGYPMERSLWMTSDRAKEIGEKLILSADSLIKKE